MMNRVWAQKKSTSTWKRRVEEHIFKDGTRHYSYRDNFGRSSDLKDFDEAQEVIQAFDMEDVTEEMVNAGWISR